MPFTIGFILFSTDDDIIPGSPIFKFWISFLTLFALLTTSSLLYLILSAVYTFGGGILFLILSLYRANCLSNWISDSGGSDGSDSLLQRKDELITIGKKFGNIE